MKPHDRHFNEDRIRWALDLVQDQTQGSRDRDPPWYNNTRVLEALLGMTEYPPREPPADLWPRVLPFTKESVYASLASGDVSNLELREKSPEINRLAVVWTIQRIWKDDDLRARLRRCAECGLLQLGERAMTRENFYCDDRCRKRRLRSTDPEVRRYRPFPPKPHRYQGDT